MSLRKTALWQAGRQAAGLPAGNTRASQGRRIEHFVPLFVANQKSMDNCKIFTFISPLSPIAYALPGIGSASRWLLKPSFVIIISASIRVPSCAGDHVCIQCACARTHTTKVFSRVSQWKALATFLNVRAYMQTQIAKGLLHCTAIRHFPDVCKRFFQGHNPGLTDISSTTNGQTLPPSAQCCHKTKS
jgi:hypothetical protein